MLQGNMEAVDGIEVQMTTVEGILQTIMAKLDVIMPQRECKGVMPKIGREESADKKDGKKSTTGPKGDDNIHHDWLTTRGSCGGKPAGDEGVRSRDQH
ncbi:unnamed protein product [Linum trigynum]